LASADESNSTVVLNACCTTALDPGAPKIVLINLMTTLSRCTPAIDVGISKSREFARQRSENQGRQ
jgi:hypothetical protein